ncbi:peptidase M15 [Nocardia panacis]|uniref:Peptidase M15 n=1 Tax=Nocardia panacis TaxID=2340916 RepID=A0A3A4K5L7_9NOCA|nr:M15 family metallopeptidase [Nocardia panacis]RJO68210.1 peptidase M15 [Nocardia panacis]
MLLRYVERGSRILGAAAALTAVLAGTAHAAPTDQRAALGSAAGTEGLDPSLAMAYTLAEREAHAQGVPLSITSGYRTPEQQRWLWEDGIRTHGSPDEARRWVLPPEESTHVSGRAVDVGPQGGAQWLEANGSRWGLCRMYGNEWWHFELATLPGAACPPVRPDAHDR